MPSLPMTELTATLFGALFGFAVCAVTLAAAGAASASYCDPLVVGFVYCALRLGASDGGPSRYLFID